VVDEEIRITGLEVHIEGDAPSTRGAPGPAGRPSGHGAARLTAVADELLPALIARLGVSDLGELEVRQGDWRVRLRRAPGAGRAEPRGGDRADGDAMARTAMGRTEPARGMVSAPAVGYYVPREEVRVGLAVTSGDLLGWVDVLGVRQEIVAPVSGTVGRLLVEPGQAVEYGQELLQVDPGPPSGRGGQDADAARAAD
jgi:biotin carboxyl carrier protein